jgi:hypothetical protein
MCEESEYIEVYSQNGRCEVVARVPVPDKYIALITKYMPVSTDRFGVCIVNNEVIDENYSIHVIQNNPVRKTIHVFGCENGLPIMFDIERNYRTWIITVKTGSLERPFHLNNRIYPRNPEIIDLMSYDRLVDRCLKKRFDIAKSESE